MEALDEIISLHGGISQQDISLRFEHQVEESINCYHTIEQGLRRRNPTAEIGSATGVDDDCFTYVYDRGLAGNLNEKYAVTYDENGFRALDLVTGLNVPVVDNSGTYMQPYTSETGYSAVTVKDVTFITNRNKEVAMTNNVSADFEREAFIWVKRAEPVDGYEYNIQIKTTEVSTGNITGTYDVSITGKLSTTAVADDIKTKIDALAITFVSVEVNGNIVRIYSTDTSYDIGIITVSDSYGNLAISSFNKEVATEDDLPSSMPFNAKIKITGTDNSENNYYLESKNGYWHETTGYNVNIEIDSTTMPHKITRLYDANDNPYFQIDPIEWNNREIGDNEDAKEPSFVGTSITDICFYKNRLGLLTPYSILFSEVGEYYNFWKTTLVANLDSDRIDSDLDARKAIRLHYIQFLQDYMIIFGDKTQFRISHSGIFSASNMSATIISEYGFNPRVKPVAIDNKIVFCALNNNANAVYLYTKDDFGETNKAENITKHVPYMLDADIGQIVGSSVNSVLFFRSETNKDTLYVYKYLENNGELVQSSWFKWKFTADIHSIFSTEGKLYLLTSRNEVLTDIDWVMWDGTWDDTQTWIDEGTWSDTGYLKNSRLEEMDIIPNQITDTYLDVGNVSYTSYVRLSEYLPTGSDGKKRLSDKINIKTIYVKGHNDSIFRLSVNHLNRETSRTIAQNYVLGKRPYIMGKAKDIRIDIESTDGYGFEINGIAYEARINNRSKGI